MYECQKYKRDCPIHDREGEVGHGDDFDVGRARSLTGLHAMGMSSALWSVLRVRGGWGDKAMRGTREGAGNGR